MPDTPSGMASPGFSTAFSVAVVRRWRLVLLIPLLIGIAVAVLILTQPRTYSSTALLVPESGGESTSLLSQLPGGLGNIAAGLLGASPPGQTPELLRQLARSRQVLDALLQSPFPAPDGAGGTRPLIEFMELPEGEPPDVRLERARIQFSTTWLATAVNDQTGVLGVTVTSPDRRLSAAVTSRLIELLNQFNLQTRQSSFRQQRLFADVQVANAADSLRLAEQALSSFYERNRVRNAPNLQFAEGRLVRRVQIHQEVYLTLRQLQETARMQEVRDTPVITVLQSPEPAALPDPRNGAIKVFVALLLGTLFVLTAIAARVRLEQWQLASPGEFKQVRGAVRDAVSWIPGMKRLFSSAQG